MATLQGITGKLSGKMGSAVFRVRDGQQVVAQYNPIVKNPNTEGQQAQRAKFKLMSQLSAVMGPGIGTLAVTKRKTKGQPSQRNAFTQINFPLIEVASENEEVTAKIPMEQIKLTSSFRNLPQLRLEGVENGISAGFTEGLPSNVSSVRFVVVNYAGNVPNLFNVIDIPRADLTGGQVKIDAPKGKYTVLAYGLIPSESAKATIDLDNIHTLEDEDFTSAVELNALVADGSIVETVTVGANVTISQ